MANATASIELPLAADYQASPNGMSQKGWLCRRSGAARIPDLPDKDKVTAMATWQEFERAGCRLACRDFGGDGANVLCLHGLAGHAGEWAPTAARLGKRCRIVGLDQPGHGRSAREPRDVTREAFVGDVVEAIRVLRLEPVVLVGQSMGANAALLTAAARPELIAGLVVIEGSPDGPAPELPDRIQRSLDRWPIPFPDEHAARQYFAAEGLEPDAWTTGLEQRSNGLWPAFDPAVMVRSIAQLAARDYWGEWRTFTCPTLVVVAEHGHLSTQHAHELAAAVPLRQAVVIPGAGHDLHLDSTEQWCEAFERFLDHHSLGDTPTPSRRCPQAES